MHKQYAFYLRNTSSRKLARKRAVAKHDHFIRLNPLRPASRYTTSGNKPWSALAQRRHLALGEVRSRTHPERKLSIRLIYWMHGGPWEQLKD